MTETFLVTGGCGFIGSHLCQRLLNDGKNVICVDSLITGAKSNIAHLGDNSRFRFIEHDITKHIEIQEKIDFILHFASPASPIDYLQLPIQTLKVGALGTHNALGLAKAKKAGILIASSSEVYGDPEIHPQTEDYWGHVNTVGPRGVYDEAKRFAEAITMAYHKTHGVNTKIARIFNTYGPRMRQKDGRVVPAFITQALRNEPITVFGDGSQTRSFCFVSDLIEGILRLSASACHDPVNMGNPSEITVLEFADIIIKLTSSKSEIVFRPLPVDDPKKRKPDITKAGKELGWKPGVPLEEGLGETIEWFKKIEGIS